LIIRIVGPAYPLRGGIADFNEALSKAFSASGDDVAVYSFYLQYPSFLFPGKTQKAEGTNAPIGVTIYPTISSVNPLSWISTARKIISEKPDLVIIRYWLPFMGPALGTIARRMKSAKIPVIAITDNVIPHEHRLGDTAFTKYFIKGCDAFVTMSASVLKDLKKFTQTEKKVFLPHPVYSIFGDKVSKTEARRKLNLLPGVKYILFFGIIRPYKGLDLLLEAMADERIKRNNIKLIIAGEFYENEKRYTELIDSLQLADSVLLHTHFIPKESVADYFCAVDLVVQPYKHATQSGITQIAYHFDKPMIVTNVGGLSEIVEDGSTGYVVATDAVALASAINDYYLHDREKEMEVNVRNGKERFSWSHFVNGIKKLYDRIN
jgi:D-inositol-3-phosphate glycosyltransferase